MSSSRYSDSGSTYYGWGATTYAVQRLILANALVLAGQLVLEIPFGPSVPPGGFVSDWLSFHSRGPWWAWAWQPFTYMFLHGGLWHLFVNMLTLFFFGPEIERTLGTRQFFGFYLGCGAVAVLLTILSTEQVVGASGAVMAVLVANVVVAPEREVYLLPFPAPINIRALVLIIIVLNIVSAIMGSGMSVLTHFGGMAAGFAYMKIMPRLWQWRRAPRFRRADRKPPKPNPKLDEVGEAVDNIFRFEDKKRRGK